MKRLFFALFATLFLSACGAEPIWAPDEAVAEARYEHVGPTSVTLYTVLSTRSGTGAHAGLLINGSERVLFDPAGTWRPNDQCARAYAASATPADRRR